MSQKTKPSPLAIALENAQTLMNCYKVFKYLTEQFIASDIGGKMLIAATHHAHTIFTSDFWHKLGQIISGG
jgi:hypothetical protein